MIEIYDNVDKLPFDTDKDIVWYFAHNEDCFTVYDTTQHIYTKNCELLRFDVIFVVYKKINISTPNGIIYKWQRIG